MPVRVDREGLVFHETARARVRKLLGGYSPLARWYRRLRPRWVWERVNPLGQATKRYADEHGLAVRSGLFSGLVYPREAIGKVSFLPAKLLGSYERELFPILGDARNFDLFVDIGSGEGLYCVGFKRLFPGTHVIGYETDRSERAVSERLAKLNSVSFESRGTADHEELNALPPGRLFLMSDVEGFEHELLDPAAVTRLLQATMLVEVHPAVHPHIIAVLTARFEATHNVEIVRGESKRAESHRELAGWEEAVAKYAISEGRSTTPLWLCLRPSDTRRTGDSSSRRQ